VVARLILLAALALLTGCGRSDRPTVRQSPAHSEDEITAAVASRPPQPADDCPARSVPHRIRPKRDAGSHAGLARESHLGPTDAMDSMRADGRLPTTADAARPKEAGAEAAVGDGREVRIGAVRLVAPKTWTRAHSPVGSLMAEFTLPRTEGDPSDAQLTITQAGGRGRRSFERLRGHLQQKPEDRSVERLQVGASEVVLSDTTGDYADTSDPFPSAANEGRYRVLSATVFAGGTVYLVNCTGPEKTVGERAGEVRAFLQTLQPVGQP